MPSQAGLGKQLGTALAGAAVILAIFIRPAEYGIALTGLGGRMGLLALSTASAAAQIDIPMAPPETARRPSMRRWWPRLTGFTAGTG